MQRYDDLNRELADEEITELLIENPAITFANDDEWWSCSWEKEMADALSEACDGQRGISIREILTYLLHTKKQ